jgi:hypothetical protein
MGLTPVVFWSSLFVAALDSAQAGGVVDRMWSTSGLTRPSVLSLENDLTYAANRWGWSPRVRWRGISSECLTACAPPPHDVMCDMSVTQVLHLHRMSVPKCDISVTPSQHICAQV